MIPPGNLSTLDFIRAFSTVAVVCVHWMGMTGHLANSLGILPRVLVLMFFVHTGFVLMASLERQHSTSPNKLWRRFMVRRLFRIYPLGAFVIAVILLFGIPSHLIPPNFHSVHLDAGGILANFLLVMNLANREPLLSPMWSLPYEFQLYLLLPSAYLLLRRRSGFAVAFGLWCLTLAPALLQPLVPHTSRLDILSYAPCFVAGLLCHEMAMTVRPRLPFFLWPLLLPAFMALSLVWPDSRPWPAAWAVCLLTAATAPFMRQSRNAFVSRLIGLVAQHSYALYLSHYFCLWLAFRANQLQAYLQWTIFAVTIVALPALLYRTIELPMIRIGRRFSDTAAEFLPAAACGVNHA